MLLGGQSISKISGNTGDLKSSQLRRLKNLLQRRVRANSVVGQEFARALCSLSHDLGRQLGVLIDRQGHVRYVIAGDATRIFIPELERNRAVRLRGLRLVHTHLHREPLSEEDLADLTLLRLDYVTAVTMDDRGLPALFHSAHILPGHSPGYRLEPPHRPGQVPEDFREKIEELELYFGREERTRSTGHSGPRAVVVGVYTREMRARRAPDESMAELRELCAAAGVVPTAEFRQNRPRIDPVTVAGSGKVKEIGIRAVQEDAELLIFDMELSPAQATRLSALSDLKIIDRTQLILDIFARNARSRDGRLQVELAQLRYLKGRLSEKDDNMSRLTGGIGGRGPGETKLEIGRRRVNDRINRLEKELSSIKTRRERNRFRREQNRIPVVSIVGYTNAGKSTLLNRLTNSTVTAEDRPFATLDPTTRRLRFPQEQEIILSDTVGFIHDLPPELQKAFEATLEELLDSDLLIHCIDVADRGYLSKVAAVEEILHDIGASDIPRLNVYNKTDLLGSSSDLPTGGLGIAAETGLGLEELTAAIEALLFSDQEEGPLVGRVAKANGVQAAESGAAVAPEPTELGVS